MATEAKSQNPFDDEVEETKNEDQQADPSSAAVVDASFTIDDEDDETTSTLTTPSTKSKKKSKKSSKKSKKKKSKREETDSSFITQSDIDSLLLEADKSHVQSRKMMGDEEAALPYPEAAKPTFIPKKEQPVVPYPEMQEPAPELTENGNSLSDIPKARKKKFQAPSICNTCFYRFKGCLSCKWVARQGCGVILFLIFILFLPFMMGVKYEEYHLQSELDADGNIIDVLQDATKDQIAIWRTLHGVSGDVIKNESSPQHHAAHFLLKQDKMGLKFKSTTLIQRYILIVLQEMSTVTSEDKVCMLVDANKSECEWETKDVPTERVYCNSDGFVSYLELDNCSIAGKLPKEIKYLEHLTYLDLSNNQLTGKVPSGYSKLKKLGNLYLDKNQIEGEVPSKVCKLKKHSMLVQFRTDCMINGPVQCSCCNDCDNAVDR